MNVVYNFFVCDLTEISLVGDWHLVSISLLYHFCFLQGNAVYNVMPDIISRLSDSEIGVKDDVDFKSIMRFLFEFIQKDKQSESLVEKLCHRFKSTW